MDRDEVNKLVSDLDTAVASFTSISDRLGELSSKMAAKKEDLALERSEVVKEMMNKTLRLDEQYKDLSKAIKRCKRISSSLSKIFK